MPGDNSGYWAAVAALSGLAADAAGVAKVLEGLERGDLEPGRLYASLKESKVVRLALSNLAAHAAWPSAERLLALLGEADRQEQRRQDAAAAPVRSALTLAAGSGLRLMKGMALQSLYPEPELRHAGDVDLHAPDLASAFTVGRGFLASGWQWELPFYPWVVWDDSGAVYGQLHYEYPDGAALVARVDLHFGDYTLRHADPLVGAYSTGPAARIPLTGWRPGRVAGVDIGICDASAAIGVIALHALGDCSLSMKDVNDLNVLITTGPVDWSLVIETCRDAGALDALGHLLAEVTAVYGTDGLPSLPGARPLRAGGAQAGPGPAGPPGSVGPAQTGGGVRAVPAGLAAGMSSAAARYYFGGELSPRLSAGDVPALSSGPARRNTCWRLLPREAWPQSGPRLVAGHTAVTRTEDLAPGLTLHRAGDRAAVVTTGGEVFIPTVWGDVHPDTLGLARQVEATARQ